MYTIIIKVYCSGVECKDWNQLIDSTTKAGATRKAKTVLKKNGYKLENKVTMTETLEGWKVQY